MSIDSISQTIDKALSAAGLNTRAGPLKAATAAIEKALASAGLTQLRRKMAEPKAPSARPVHGELPGQFLALSYANGQASRAYKLYIPSSHDGQPAPLIVMLHGCKQNPDDFAAGTRMNALAEREGFLVAYPAQTPRDNGANCWNWFDRAQQSRDGIEPSLIAGIVGDIAQRHEVDASRVFVAGLSAGAAMAVILGATYPEVFAGVAAHSGLPVGAAHDVPSAFAAMHGRAAAPRGATLGPAVPTIVFHGDSDSTVAATNGTAIIERAVQAHEQADMALTKRLRAQPGADASARSKQVTTTEFLDANGKPRIEEWVVHGGNHAWFGGSPEGSYTDANGPDATAEIVRFFLGLKGPRPSGWLAGLIR